MWVGAIGGVSREAIETGLRFGRRLNPSGQAPGFLRSKKIAMKREYWVVIIFGVATLLLEVEKWQSSNMRDILLLLLY